MKKMQQTMCVRSLPSGKGLLDNLVDQAQAIVRLLYACLCDQTATACFAL